MTNLHNLLELTTCYLTSIVSDYASKSVLWINQYVNVYFPNNRAIRSAYKGYLSITAVSRNRPIIYD